jgi:hypothetical protein
MGNTSEKRAKLNRHPRKLFILSKAFVRWLAASYLEMLTIQHAWREVVRLVVIHVTSTTGFEIVEVPASVVDNRTFLLTLQYSFGRRRHRRKVTRTKCVAPLVPLFNPVTCTVHAVLTAADGYVENDQEKSKRSLLYPKRHLQHVSWNLNQHTKWSLDRYFRLNIDNIL